MWRRRERKPTAVDTDHMRVLHQEAIEQLDLMRTALEATEQATGTMRDNLETMAENHWHAYLDVVHMLNMHDEALAQIMKKHGMSLRNSDDEVSNHQLLPNRASLLLLVAALIRRHQRLVYLWGLRSSPMTDYYRESMNMEREHTAELIAMVEMLIQ